MKPNEIDVFAAPMFRHLEKVEYAFETACACKSRSNIVESNRDNRFDFDLARLRSVSFANGYARPMPYPDTAGDRARSDAIAQILYEEHAASLSRNRWIGFRCEWQLLASAQRFAQPHAALRFPPRDAKRPAKARRGTCPGRHRIQHSRAGRWRARPANEDGMVR